MKKDRINDNDAPVDEMETEAVATEPIKPNMFVATLMFVVLIVFLIIIIISYDNLDVPESTSIYLQNGLRLLVVGSVCVYFLFRNRRYKSSIKKAYSCIIRNAFDGNSKAKKKLIKALSIYSEHKFDEALKLFSGLSAECSESDDHSCVHMLMAECYSKKKEPQYEIAIDEYKIALKYSPDFSVAWACYSVSCIKDGKLDDAEKAIDSARKSGFDERKCVAISEVIKRRKNQQLYEQALESKKQIAEKFIYSRQQVEAVVEAVCKDTEMPAVELRIVEGKPLLSDSKLGGVPYIPLNGSIPKNATGAYLKLLCQLNCEDFAGSLPYFPKNGIVQFYINDNDLCGENFVGSCDQSGFKIIYQPVVDMSITESKVMQRFDYECGSDEKLFPIKGEYKLMAFPVTDSMPFDCDGFDELFIRKSKEMGTDFSQCGAEGLLDLPDEIRKSVAEKYSDSCHKAGGYPSFMQRDVRSKNENYNKYDTLLLHIISDIADGKSRVMWGNGGMCNFLINSEKLRRLDFADVLCCQNCC